MIANHHSLLFTKTWLLHDWLFTIEHGLFIITIVAYEPLDTIKWLYDLYTIAHHDSTIK